jgi:Nif-specific regulatory protein
VKKHRLPRVGLSSNAIDALVAAEWPGNIRQLQNMVEAATIRAAGEDVPLVQQHHVFPNESPAEDQHRTLQAATRAFQRNLLQRTLVDCGWNVAETARRLDVARSNLYKLIRIFGLEREP